MQLADSPRLWDTFMGLLVAVILLSSSTIEAADSSNARVLARSRAHDAIEATWPKVVKIFGAGGFRGLYSYCSGFLVSPTGHIVTISSHVLDAPTVTVVLHDGRRFDGRVIGIEPTLDLAVLKIDAEDLPYFDLNQSTTGRLGQRVLAFGNLFKVATGDEQVSVLHGVISAESKLSARRGVFNASYNGPIYVVDAITNNPGSGGGVLTNYEGELLGMLGKELQDSRSNTWINYVTPASEFREIAGEIISGQFRSRKRTEDDDSSIAGVAPQGEPRKLGLVLVADVVARTPPYVDRVVPDSVASKQGVAADDLILFVDDQLIQSVRQFREILGRTPANQTLQVIVRRGDTLVPVTLRWPGSVEATEE